MPYLALYLRGDKHSSLQGPSVDQRVIFETGKKKNYFLLKKKISTVILFVTLVLCDWTQWQSIWQYMCILGKIG